MEFTITPTSGTSFSVTSIELQVQRASSGPRGIALRSSIDNYLTNLDQEYPIIDNTITQSFTFSFSQPNNSLSVTYRIYMWAESTSSEGGIGDSISNDIIVNGVPVLSEPTIQLSESTLSGFEYEVGSGPSEEQTFTVEGALLAQDIFITPSIDYEISTGTGALFVASNPITLTNNFGIVDVTSIYVRLKSGLSIASYNNENITVSSVGATDQQVNCNGEVLEIIPEFVINEILADPDNTEGDANGDGIIDSFDDEFVEIVNRSGDSVDISGWQLFDITELRHTVPASTIIGNNEFFVIFGGGTPSESIPGVVQTASTGKLGFYNGGDTITLKTSLGNTVVTESYGGLAAANQSIARDPDYTGSFVRHLSISSNPVRFSPGENNSNDPPLPVVLSSFYAEFAANELAIIWTTQSEVTLSGWNVYKANSNDFDLSEKLNTALIPAAGSSTETNSYRYVDNSENINSDQTYYYWLEAIDNTGMSTLTDSISYTIPENDNPDSPDLNAKYGLSQNYPNPFNPTTEIKFRLANNGNAKLEIYNIKGQIVETLFDGFVNADQEITKVWNADNITSGVYFYKLTAGGKTYTRKMILMK